MSSADCDWAQWGTIAPFSLTPSLVQVSLVILASLTGKSRKAREQVSMGKLVKPLLHSMDEQTRAAVSKVTDLGGLLMEWKEWKGCMFYILFTQNEMTRELRMSQVKHITMQEKIWTKASRRSVILEKRIRGVQEWLVQAPSGGSTSSVFRELHIDQRLKWSAMGE